MYRHSFIIFIRQPIIYAVSADFVGRPAYHARLACEGVAGRKGGEK